MGFRMFADKMTVGCLIVTPDNTIDLNDHVSYALSGEATREQVAAQYNQQKASSPVLAGEYLVHSVPGMVVETVKVYVFGTTQVALAANEKALKTAFENWSYQLAWTWADYSEHWNCNAVPSIGFEKGQVFMHSYMSAATLQVPRFPAVVVP